MINIAAIILAGLLGNTPSSSADLMITLHNVKEAEGKMRIAVYRPSDDFPEEGSYKTFVVDAKAPETSLNVALPRGRYAIAVVHDINSNGDMDLNIIGMPQEPYGISNNPSLSLSKPKFSQASFTLEENMSISIDLVHL